MLVIKVETKESEKVKLKRETEIHQNHLSRKLNFGVVYNYRKPAACSLRKLLMTAQIMAAAAAAAAAPLIIHQHLGENCIH